MALGNPHKWPFHLKCVVSFGTNTVLSRLKFISSFSVQQSNILPPYPLHHFCVTGTSVQKHHSDKGFKLVVAHKKMQIKRINRNSCSIYYRFNNMRISHHCIHWISICFSLSLGVTDSVKVHDRLNNVILSAEPLVSKHAVWLNEMAEVERERDRCTIGYFSILNKLLRNSMNRFD